MPAEKQSGPPPDFPKFERYTDVTIGDNVITCPVYYWKDNSVLPFPMPKPGTVKLRVKKQDITYLKIYSGFDIETSNVDIPKNDKGDVTHLAFMYHWQFSFVSDSSGIVFMGRYWSEFLHLMEKLESFYGLGFDKRILIWIANAGFEFQFIRKKFDWAEDDFFAREERHPLKFRTGGYEFHEALTISGGSLAQLAKDYTVTQKLKGDLDFKIFRSGKTPLEFGEKSYCINDVTILSEWSYFIFITYIMPDKRIPLTKTGILRSECRQELIKMLGRDGFKRYMQLIKEAYPSQEEYFMWFKWLFRGGYVHSNILLTGIKIGSKKKKVKGKDRTSSYPAEMLTKLNDWPITPFKDEEFSEEALKEKCCIMELTLKDVRRKTSLSLESKSKCIELVGTKKYPVVIDNGRVAQAGKMRVMLTEIDLELYRLYYDFKIETVHSFKTSKRGALPLFLRKVLATYYKKKDQLKKSGQKDTPEYVIVKQKNNSFFGMMVTRIELDKITYSDKWEVLEKELDFEDEVKGQFLLPQWGIYCTALARRELLLPTMKITERIGYGNGKNGAGVIYNDTDSIKYYDPDGLAEEVFEEYNEEMRATLKAAGLTAPEFNTLGTYEADGESGEFEAFKTLGAKRYLATEHGVTHATIAGLPKAAILNVEGDPYEAFNADGMLIDAELSLKNGISYNDSFTSYTAPDGEVMSEDSSAGIFDMSFNMNLDKIYYTIVTDGLTERLRKYGD